MDSNNIQKVLDYSLILVYDYLSLSTDFVTTDKLIEIFIRNSLKIPGITRLVQYFEEHIGGKSAICEDQGRRIQDWVRYHNRLKKRPGYEQLVPFSRMERDAIKDIRFVKYKIISYEVANNINGIKTFDFFDKQRFFLESPSTPDELKKREVQKNTKFNESTPPQRKLRDNLPDVR